MINLPHTLDVVNIIGSRGDNSFGFRFNQAATDIDDFIAGNEEGRYVFSPSTYRASVRNRYLLISAIDSNGNRLPENIKSPHPPTSQQPFAGSTRIDMVFAIGGLPQFQSYFVFITPKPDNATGMDIKYWELFLAPAQGTPPFIATNSAILIEFIGVDVQVEEPRLIGNFVERIKCNVTQLARSLDNTYQERYLIVTPYQFPLQQRNVHLIRVENEPRGFRNTLLSLKTERIETYGNLSQVIASSFPDFITDQLIDIEIMEFIGEDGEVYEITLPRVINRE
ncbi:hypothetical protein F4X10_24035 [Candidatus Poribacteria bacterium]|nr:hypothetical protein [Candidatus Poribacteria bacterium]